MPDEHTTPPRETVAHVTRAKQQAERDLFAIPGVHTVGVGFKRVDGELTDEVAIVVYVDRKLSREELRPGWLVPPTIATFGDDGEPVRTDVVERPRAVEYPHLPDGSLAGRVRPVPGGRSIEGNNGGGTLGGWVWDDVNDEPVLLSNNHVLGGIVGANVYQPWGSTSLVDQIADNVRTGTLDATIAAPTDPDHVVYEIEGVGPAVYETTTPVLGMAVEKSGATTEHTTGTIVAINLSLGHNGSTADFEVDPDPGVPKMAYYGDSGSLIVERTHPDGAEWKRVVGLLWGGVPSENNAYAHPIEDVFDDLQLTTICSGLIGQLLDNMFAEEESEGFGRLSRTIRPDELVEVRSPRPLPGAVVPGRVLRRPPNIPLETGIASRIRSGWRRVVEVPRQRGLAREVEAALKKTEKGDRIAGLVQKHRVDLARLGMSRTHRRVLESAAAPFLKGTWSAEEVLAKPVSREDADRFRRALELVEQEDSLADLVAEAREVLDELPGQTLREVLERF
jgi:hypothetical protein